MSFFDMGMGEILLVIIVALIIWGPGKLPEIARTLGKTIATLRKTSFDLTTEIRKELEGEEKDHPSQSILSHDNKPSGTSDVAASEMDDDEKAKPRNQGDISDKK